MLQPHVYNSLTVRHVVLLYTHEAVKPQVKSKQYECLERTNVTRASR